MIYNAVHMIRIIPVYKQIENKGKHKDIKGAKIEPPFPQKIPKHTCKIETKIVKNKTTNNHMLIYKLFDITITTLISCL